MKKIVSVIILFCLFFVIIPNVDAEDYNLIYSITSLNIDTDSQVMTFKGFAFIDHMDNYGGDNLSTYIILSGGGKEPLRFPVTYDKGGYNSGDSYYWTRCTSSGCTHQRIKELKDEKRQSKNCNDGSNSDCAYFDVEFKVDIDMVKLNTYFGANTNISFEIETINTISNTKRTAGLGVHKSVCGIDDIPGTCSDDYIDLGIDNKGKVVLGGVGERITVTANSARARYENNRDEVTDDHRYYSGTFDTLIYEPEDSIPAAWNKDHIIKVNFYVVRGHASGGNIVNGGSEKYVIYDSWVKVEGQMSIKFGEMPIVEPEPTGYCPTDYEDTDISKTTTCNDKDVEFKSCKTYEVTFKAEYDLSDNLPTDEKYCGDLPVVDILVKASILILEEGVFYFGSTADSVYSGKSFDFPEITYLNKIKWQFAKNSNNEKITSVSIVDGNGNPTNSKTLKYGKEDTKCEGGSECSMCESPEGSVPCVPGCVPKPCKDVTYCNSDAGSYEIKLSDTVTYNGKSGTINSFIKKKAIETVKDMIKDYDNYSEDVIEESNVKSYDSNVISSLKNINDTNGKWKRTDGDDWADETLKEDTYYSSTYEFDLYNSCVKLIGDDIGNIKYVSSKTCPTNYKKYGSNSYFVPFQFPSGSDAFRVNITKNDISFVDGIEWNLSGTCSIDVENKLYENKDGSSGSGDNLKVRYRSIDLDNPFPKGNVPVNWSNWYASQVNKNRLKNTYNNGFVYSVSLINGNSDGINLGISTVNNDTRLPDYNSWANMNKNGTSQFINNYGSYFTKDNTNSYCKISEFSSSCDKYG